jgi:hypothetical protein
MGWIIFGVIVVLLAILANGFIAKVEDNSPGGFNNPDGKWLNVIRQPKTHQVIIWLLGFCAIIWLIYLFITK